METWFACKSITGYRIATKFCTCHDSTATWMKTKYIFIEFVIQRENRSWTIIDYPYPVTIRCDILRVIANLLWLTHWGRVTHICVRPWCHWTESSLVQVMGLGASLFLNQSFLLSIGTMQTNFSEILIEIQRISWKICIWKCRLQNVSHLVRFHWVSKCHLFICMGVASNGLTLPMLVPYICGTRSGARPINAISIEFDQNLQYSGLKCSLPITTKFCTRHDSVTVVTCAKFSCDRLSVF